MGEMKQGQNGRAVVCVAERAAQLDAVATKAAEAFGSPMQNVAMALQLAEGIEQMRALFDTPEIKQRIVALQDTRLGFRTDRDPKQINRRTGKPNEPYPWETVRECCLEALLRGVTLCGNQFNIIANGTYVTKEGYQFKLGRVKGFADFKPLISVPKTMAGGAIVHCEATWTLNGTPNSLAVDIAAKGDDYTGTDGYVGKAERKFFKRVFEIVTGRTGEPDGDVDDAPKGLPIAHVPGPTFLEEAATQATKGTEARTAPESEVNSNGPKVQRQGQRPTVTMPPVQAEAAPGESPTAPPGNRQETIADSQTVTPQEQLAAVVHQAGFTFEDLIRWGDATGNISDATSYPDWPDLPTKVAERLYNARKGLLTALQAERRAQNGRAR